MTQKTKANLALAAFFTACLLPAAGMLLPEEEAAANQTLAPKPALTRTDGSLNPNVLKEIDDYIADHFAFRQKLITANAALEAALFHTSAEETVLLGREGWLFYRETLDGYLHTAPLTERQIYGAAHTLALVNEYAAARGAKLLFTVAPNKASLYPQYLPAVGEPLDGEDDIDRLRPLLEQEGVPYADLFAAFRAQEETLYYPRDSHWDTRGAALAHDVLLDALGKETAAFFDEPHHAAEGHRGDLYEMLFPSGTALDEAAEYDRDFTFTYTKQPRSMEDQRIETTNPAQSGRLLLFRDSFGNSLHPFLAEEFGAALISRAMPYQLSLLDETGADTLLIEIVERNLDWLATRAPVFPAPVRGLTGEPPEGSARAELTVLDDGMLPGFRRVEGTLTGAVDAASPLYVQLDGTLYEASPAGEGDCPLTLYVPSETDFSAAKVLYLADGALYAAPAVCHS